MRLWSLHPSSLDRQGLLACWREALLAQAVLAGRTKGYTRHPQLERFRAADGEAGAAPLTLVGAYLTGVAHEAELRGYRFDRARIDAPGAPAPTLPVTTGQLEFEWGHLVAKLSARSPDWLERLGAGAGAGAARQPHPLFFKVSGGIETWERPG